MNAERRQVAGEGDRSGAGADPAPAAVKQVDTLKSACSALIIRRRSLRAGRRRYPSLVEKTVSVLPMSMAMGS
jgi:hypothetical protein